MITLDRCRQLIDTGYSLITVGENKIPNIKWKQYQSEQPDKDDFSKLYDLPTTKNVGIVTGFWNVECLDIDLKVLPTLKEQQDFWREFYSFVSDNIDDFDKKFVIYKTINNGYHILYRCATIGNNQKIAKLEGHKEAIIETRGVGGYVFVYGNKVGELDYADIKEISPKEREVLLSCAAVYDHKEEPTDAPQDYEPARVENEVTPWDDYNNRTNILDLVADEMKVIRATSRHFLVKRHGATSPHSGYVYRNSGCMYLFSTGTQYPAEKLLSPFAVYAIKHHHGDFSAAAKDLYRQGYGSRKIKRREKIDLPKIKQSDLDFPIDIFPDITQRYILESERTLSLSRDYMGCSLIWMISLCVGNTMSVEIKKGWREKGVVWLCLVGRAGVGKTPSITQIIGPLESVNNREIKRYQSELAKFAVYDRLSKEEKKQTEEIKKPRKSQFIVNDITLEALVESHQEQKKSIGVFKDELAGWFKDMNKYRQGSDFEFHLSSWSGKSVAMNRKTATSSFVQHPFIPVLGGIQPSILEKFSGDDFKDSGFLDRLLISYPELTVDNYNEDEMSESLIHDWFDRTLAFMQIMDNQVEMDAEGEVMNQVITMDSDAKKEWVKAFNRITAMQNSADESEFFKSMLPKQKSYIPRFALLLHVFSVCNDEQDDLYQISAESVRKAVKLSDYFIAHAKRVKVESREIETVRKAIKGIDDPLEKFKAAHEANPDLSKTKLADLLQVSRRTVYRYFERVEKESKMKEKSKNNDS